MLAIQPGGEVVDDDLRCQIDIAGGKRVVQRRVDQLCIAKPDAGAAVQID